MANTDKNFRLSKTSKAMYSLIFDKTVRNAWLKSMVDAEQTAAVARRKAMRSREKSDD